MMLIFFSESIPNLHLSFAFPTSAFTNNVKACSPHKTGNVQEFVALKYSLKENSNFKAGHREKCQDYLLQIRSIRIHLLTFSSICKNIHDRMTQMDIKRLLVYPILHNCAFKTSCSLTSWKSKEQRDTHIYPPTYTLQQMAQFYCHYDQADTIISYHSRNENSECLNTKN